MVGNFDYNNEDVMSILNNQNFTDEQKKMLFEKYKSDLKETRRKEIITRLNECAKNNPIITQEEYVNFLKQYNDDDLSKPFEVIENELDTFSRRMQDKYEQYLQSKAKAAKVEVEEPSIEDVEIEDEIRPDVTPIGYGEKQVEESYLDDTISNELRVEEDGSEPTVFEDNVVKEMMPEQIPEALDEKGNASAIIVSIIAIIVGMVVMYSIIKLK